MPISPNQYSDWVVSQKDFSQKTFHRKSFMPVLWDKANLKAEYESSLDGESFKHMKKVMGFTVCLDHPCQGHGQGNSWAIIVPEDPAAAGKDSHKSFAEWDEDWGELQSRSKPQECPSFPFPGDREKGFHKYFKTEEAGSCFSMSASLPPGGTSHTKQGYGPHSSKVEFCLPEPPLCFRRRHCIKKGQQHQFCINAGLSKRG